MKRVIVTSVAAFSLAACNVAADTQAAEQGVASFHKAMDAGEYAAIYDASAGDMKSTTPRGDFLKLLAALHSKLGNYRSGKTVGWHDNATTGGHYVTLSRQVQFDRGPGTEEFVFRVDGNRAELAGYHVNSNALITG